MSLVTGMTPLACALVGLRRAKDAREDMITRKADHVIAMSMAAMSLASSASNNTPPSPLDISESKESIEMVGKSGTADSLLTPSNKANDMTRPLPLLRPESRPEIAFQMSREKTSDAEVSRDIPLARF